MAYPDLKRAVIEQALAFKPSTILIEDKASGTQLIQDLIAGGLSHVQRYMGAGDKVMRLHAQTATIENGFVYVPVKAPWLAEYLAELTTFPNSKYKDQTDSTSQALDWIKVPTPALLEYYRREVEDRKRRNGLA
jgi:predicted phage terminase large subunit-like protein